jgi:hypothetical protein
VKLTKVYCDTLYYEIKHEVIHMYIDYLLHKTTSTFLFFLENHLFPENVCLVEINENEGLEEINRKFRETFHIEEPDLVFKVCIGISVVDGRLRGLSGCDCMVVGFTTACAISAYHY